jgi:membrane-bound lytic murein transglycosylase D
VVLVPKTTAESNKDIAQEIADNATLAVAPDGPPRKKIKIKVGRRDSMASITARYKVTAAEVRIWNDLNSDKLKPGQELKLEVRAGKKGKGKNASAKADSDKASKGGRVKSDPSVRREREAKTVEPRHRKRQD